MYFGAAQISTAHRPLMLPYSISHVSMQLLFRQIREDYLVEAMEIVEMFCDLMLARFGLLTQMMELDEGIAECVSSLLWVAPRLQSDVAELKVISDILTAKYGKPYAEIARTATGDHKVSDKLMHKLAVQAPPKLLVEK